MEPLFDSTADVPPEDAASALGPPEENWSIDLTRSVGREVKRWRKQRRLSAQQLSDRTRQLGHHVSRTVIVNIETGRRDTVNVSQLLILAAALDVPPVLLISPVGTEATVKILPGIEETTWRARGWVIGALAPSYSTFSPRRWQEARHGIELYDIHRLLVNECRQIMKRIERIAGSEEVDIVDLSLREDVTGLQRRMLNDTVSELVYSLDKLRAHRSYIQGEGFHVPELPGNLLIMLRESDSGGRHRQEEADVAVDEPGAGADLLPPIIYDKVRRAMRGESRSQ